MLTPSSNDGPSLTLLDQSATLADSAGESVWPMRPRPVPGETLPSWLRAMGRIYRVDTKTMVHLLGLPIRRQNYRTIHNAAHHFAAKVSLLSGCRVGDLERMAATWQLPALQRFSAETTKTIITGLAGSSYCPLCLRKYDGRWLTDWLNPLYTYCPEHGVRLEKLCPRCQCRPFHGTDWLWANGPGWQCSKTNAPTPEDDAAKTRLCGFDLRRAEPTADATQERLFAQAHLKEVLDAALVGAQGIPVCGTVVTPRDACALFLGLITHGNGLTAHKSGYRATPQTPRAVMEASRILLAATQREAQIELAATNRKTRISLTVPTLLGGWLQLDNDRAPVSGHTIFKGGGQDTQGGPWEVWNREAMLPRIDFHERYLPAVIWTSALAGPASKHDSPAKIAISVALVRAIHRCDWAKAAARLGIQYKDHHLLSGHTRKNNLVGEISRQIHRLKPFLESLDTTDPEVIDYGRRRKELANPEQLLETITQYWLDALGTSADLPALTYRFWAMYTGGDIRFVPALYSRLTVSTIETQMWRTDQDYRRTVHHHFNILAKDILRAHGIAEPVTWHPHIPTVDQ
ncbi:TniQ family protein [Arthrobacter sp. GMC3]|uniref:TniQ family protein n=1 Tax=Arthrobacter sp. GMC3 TaxID=2058894 RepID=UPI000CE4BE41|nr:TniQ family protein [Arthrobacter sp. GMC3]